MQGNFLVAIVGSVVELLEAREERGFDRADFFLRFYEVKFEDQVLSGACQCGNFNSPSVWCVVIPECRQNAWSRQRSEAR